jgi:hypothetical protein
MNKKSNKKNRQKKSTRRIKSTNPRMIRKAVRSRKCINLKRNNRRNKSKSLRKVQLVRKLWTSILSKHF